MWKRSRRFWGSRGQPQAFVCGLRSAEETGKVVREIFELMASGISPIKIARLLNQRGIPAPSKSHNMEGCRKQWGRYGAECFWTADRIRHMVKDERYTGTMVSLKTNGGKSPRKSG